MADHDNNANDDIPTKRESHQYTFFRSSLNSNKSSAPVPSRSQTHGLSQRLDNFEPDVEKAEASTPPERADSDTLPFPSSPAPDVPYTRSRGDDNVKKKKKGRGAGKGTSHSAPGSRAGDVRGAEHLSVPEPALGLHELSPTSPEPAPQTPGAREQNRQTNREHGVSSPSRDSRTRRSHRLSHLLGRRPPGASGSQTDITALPSMSDDHGVAGEYIRSKPTPSAQKASRYATELYTISFLIFFAILGTLARLGLQALTFYPGAPVTFSELWANVAGTFIMGFLAEDRRLFRAEWGNKGDPLPEPSDRPAEPDTANYRTAKARHTKVKKTIPLYIGLATGFCGSFTSFSSFIRDIFLALSNNLRSPINHPYPPNIAVPLPSTTIARNGGYSFLAICATIIITISACYSALKVGAHLALLLDPVIPTLPFRFTRRVIDPLVVLLGWGLWLAAILLSIFPPHNAWRGQALLACAFAPIGCLARYYVSLYLNAIVPSFPLGTFTVNIFGTAVLGMAYDLQHVHILGTGLVGGSIIACQVLQGIMDGFCGALTTVSTWILEIDTLKRRHAYTYGAVSVATALSLLVVIMGSVRWTVGWSAIICTT